MKMGNETGNEKNSLLKTVLKIGGDVLLFLVVAFALFVLIVSIAAKKDTDGTATVFGTQLRFVQSDSMAKCDLTDVSGFEIKSIPVKSCVFIEVVPEDAEKKAEWYKKLKVGDVLTFKYVYTKQETITHRIINIKDNGAGGYFITLEGDNKTSESNLLTQTINTSLSDSPNYVIGKVTGQSYALGLMVYAFKTPVGIVCLIIIPCLIIIVFEVLRLVRVFGGEKKERIKAEQAKQASEIEELKRQLAALQNGGAIPGAAATVTPEAQVNTAASETASEATVAPEVAPEIPATTTANEATSTPVNAPEAQASTETIEATAEIPSDKTDV